MVVRSYERANAQPSTAPHGGRADLYSGVSRRVRNQPDAKLSHTAECWLLRVLVDQRLRELAATTAARANAQLLGELLDILRPLHQRLADVGLLDGLTQTNVHKRIQTQIILNCNHFWRVFRAGSANGTSRIEV